MFKKILRFARHIRAYLQTQHPLLQPLTQEFIERKNKELEQHYGNEILVVIEQSLPIAQLATNISAKQRAIDLFSQYRVWDTDQNDGILLYILIADHAVEIVSDRAYNDAQVQPQWQEICGIICQAFHQQKYTQGITEGLEKIFILANSKFQPQKRENELRNKPIIH